MAGAEETRSLALGIAFWPIAAALFRALVFGLCDVRFHLGGSERGCTVSLARRASAGRLPKPAGLDAAPSASPSPGAAVARDRHSCCNDGARHVGAYCC